MLDGVKKGLGTALGGVEQLPRSPWGVAAGAAHAIGDGIDAVSRAASDAAGAVEAKASALWDGIKGADPTMARAA